MQKLRFNFGTFDYELFKFSQNDILSIKLTELDTLEIYRYPVNKELSIYVRQPNLCDLVIDLPLDIKVLPNGTEDKIHYILKHKISLTSNLITIILGILNKLYSILAVVEAKFLFDLKS